MGRGCGRLWEWPPSWPPPWGAPLSLQAPPPALFPCTRAEQGARESDSETFSTRLTCPAGGWAPLSVRVPVRASGHGHLLVQRLHGQACVSAFAHVFPCVRVPACANVSVSRGYSGHVCGFVRPWVFMRVCLGLACADCRTLCGGSGQEGSSARQRGRVWGCAGLWHCWKGRGGCHDTGIVTEGWAL